MRILASFTLALVLAAVVYGQAGMTGKWQGHTASGTEVVLDLKAGGEKLSGTLTRRGESSPITEGKVSKSTLSFKAVIGEQTEALSGELVGEQLKVWLDRQPEEAVVFKRVKE